MQNNSAALLPCASYERDPTIDYQVHKDVLYAMATCHSLREIDGEIIGDPLDIKMFEFTRWSFTEVVQRNSNPADEASIGPPSIAKPPAGQEYSFDEVDGSSAVSNRKNHHQCTCDNMKILSRINQLP